jgi:hypothetical protein
MNTKNVINLVDINCINVAAKEWFDKINGNSYFSADVQVIYHNKQVKNFKIPFSYGYGDSYIFKALEILKNNNICFFDNTYSLRDAGIIFISNIQRGCKKSQL